MERSFLRRLARRSLAVTVGVMTIGLALMAGNGLALPAHAASVPGWSASNQLPFSLKNQVTVTDGNYLYVAGGTTTTGTSSAVYSAPIGANGAVGPTWTKQHSMPTLLDDHAGVLQGNTLFILGGLNAKGIAQTAVYSASVNSATGAVGAWSATAALPTAVYDSAAVASGNFVWNIGGYDSTGTGLSTVSVAQQTGGTLGTWASTTPLPTALGDFSAAVFNGWIYVLGGDTAEKGTGANTVYAAQILSNGQLGAWQTLNPLPVAGKARWDGAAIAAAGHLWFIGGYASSALPQSTVLRAPINADGSIGSWLDLTPLPAAIGDQALAYAQGYLFNAGGTTASANVSTIYTAPEAGPWVMLSDYGIPTPVNAGSALTVSGTGFQANETVNIAFNGTDTGVTATADGTGSFGIGGGGPSFQVPGGTSNGTYPVTLTGQTSNKQGQAYVVVAGSGGSGTFTATPAAIALATAPSTTPAAATFVLKNTGSGTLNWSLTSSLPTWIASALPTSGSLAFGASQKLTVTFKALGATPQTYTTNLTYTDASASNSPFSVPVTVVATPGSTSWYFAEGYTGGNATEYLTIANPNASGTAHVTATYLLGSGSPIIKHYTVNAQARFTQVVNSEVGPNQNVSMALSSDLPIVAERPYYVTYIGTFGSLPSGTDVLGATALATQFDFANVDSSAGHDTWLTILNSNGSAMTVTINYYPRAGGSPTIIHHSVPANSRGTVPVQYESGLPRGAYSATVTLSVPGLVERTLYQLHDTVTGYPGAADVIGVSSPQSSWYFAEGYSSPTVNERYVLANPGSVTAHATVTFLLADGSAHAAPSVTLAPGQQVAVPASATIGTAGVSNSATVASDQPILAERLMSSIYVGSAGAGSQVIHAPGLSEVLGASNTAHLFQFAEGYTGGQVAEYLTIENPDASHTAMVTVTFLPANGSAPTVKVYAIGPHSRFTLYTNSVLPGAFFAMTVESNLPVLAERPMSFIYNGFAPGSTDIIGYEPLGS